MREGGRREKRCGRIALTTPISLHSLGAKTVIHPTARIIAEGGPIIIGDNNLIMDRATIINKLV